MHVPLTAGFWTIVEESDWLRIAPHTWCVFNLHTKWPYAVSGSRGCVNGRIILHRLLLDAPPELHVDHINLDTLDNRRSNLRLVTPAENHANQRPFGATSRFRGVRWHRGKWVGQVMFRGHLHYLGRFVDEEDAARAVDRALLEAWGAHARLNFPDNGA
jgi:hypothetical protein